jgi:hypothetical protein
MAMPDPSQMSGIPRPDPSVPAGRLSIRVLRGDFAHPMVGQEVQLDGTGGPRSAKVDETAHAVFDGLAIGETYTAHATAGDQTVTSQPVEMPPSSGVKLMLVFKPDAKALLGEHDGVARADKALPAGAIALSVVDGDDKPAAGLEAILAHTTADNVSKIDEKRARTDAQGNVRFDGLAVSARDGYLVAIKGDGIDATSKPFRPDGAAGMRLGLRALRGTRDPQVLAIGRQSHLIVEVRDDDVAVTENLVLSNQATDPFDAGPGGLRFPLPDGAKGAELGPDAPAGLALDGNALVLKGRLPPGDAHVVVGFVLPQEGNAVWLRQTLPVAMEQLVIATDRYEGMDVDGDGLSRTDREMGGRSFWLITGGAVPAGGAIDVRLSGLPHRSPWARYLVAALAALVALWGLGAALGGTTSAPSRVELDRKRGALLDELAALDGAAEIDAASAKPGRVPSAKQESKRARRREELLGQLEQVYRDLDALV